MSFPSEAAEGEASAGTASKPVFEVWRKASKFTIELWKVRQNLVQAVDAREDWIVFEDIDIVTSLTVTKFIDESPELKKHVKSYAYNASRKTFGLHLYSLLATHDCMITWVTHGLFNNRTVSEQVQEERLSLEGNTSCSSFSGTFSQSTKAPDYAIRLEGIYFPRIIFEVGVSENLKQLRQDAELWLLGSEHNREAGVIMVVIISIKGDSNYKNVDLETWKLNEARNRIVLTVSKDFRTDKDEELEGQDLQILYSDLFGMPFCSLHGLAPTEWFALPLKKLARKIQMNVFKDAALKKAIVEGKKIARDAERESSNKRKEREHEDEVKRRDERAANW